MRRRRTPHRTGFTLIELLLAVSVIGIVSSVVIVAVSPRKNITSVRDAERKHMEKQLGQALYARLVDKWELPEGIPEGEAAAKPICRQDISDAACGGAGGVSLSALPPQYISAIPVDPVVPEDGKCTGYMVYQEVGRPRVYAANVGKLPGDVPEGACSGPPAVITTGLLGYWKFDDGAGATATDSSGNNYHGVVTNMTAESWVTTTAPTGFSNPSALQFNVSDTNDFVDLQGTALLNYTYNDFTITAWYKSTDATVADDHYIYFQYKGGSDDKIIMNPTDDTGNVDRLRFQTQDAGTSYDDYGTTDVVDQQWHHLAVERGGGKKKIFVDGVLQREVVDPIAGAMTPNRDGPFIGSEVKYISGVPTVLGNEAHGTIDDVRVYNRALSDAEIEQIAAGEG